MRLAALAVAVCLGVENLRSIYGSIVGVLLRLRYFNLHYSPLRQFWAMVGVNTPTLAVASSILFYLSVYCAPSMPTLEAASSGYPSARTGLRSTAFLALLASVAGIANFIFFLATLPSQIAHSFSLWYRVTLALRLMSLLALVCFFFLYLDSPAPTRLRARTSSEVSPKRGGVWAPRMPR